jgi:hypothetical protein
MLREMIVEHLFIGESLRHYWAAGVNDVEVLRSQSDSFGYDLVMGRGQLVRHIQLKILRVGGRVSNAKIALKLMEKPSGCVIWIVVTQDLQFDHFLWFGAPAGEPLPDLRDFKIAKHTKGDSNGTKAERPAHRLVPRRCFEQLPSLDAVLLRLFGQIG